MSQYLSVFPFVLNFVKHFKLNKMDDFLTFWLGKKLENQVITKETADSFTLSKRCPCHRLFDSAALILKSCRTLDKRLQNNPMIDRFFRTLDEVEKQIIDFQGFDGKVVIVLEGLQGSGKSAVMRDIAKVSGAATILSASSNDTLGNVRHIFHSMPASVAKAFDHISNYFIVRDIMKSDKQLFLVERFHHATCVDSVCEVVSTAEEVQQLSKAAFEWPFDLPMPELVLFLSVPTEVRLERLQTGSSRKDPAAAIAKDAKENLAYSMICGPTTVGIDGSGSVAEVVSIIFAAFDFYGVHVPIAVASSEGADGHGENTTSEVVLSPSPTSSSSGTASKHTSSDGSSRRATRNDFVVDGGGEEVLPGGLSSFPRDNRRISMGVYGMFSK